MPVIAQPETTAEAARKSLRFKSAIEHPPFPIRFPDVLVRFRTVRDPFSIPNVYILAVFDGNTSDSAEKNNYLGYYWKRIGLLRLMTPYPLIENKENLLDKNVWFSTIRYSF